MKRNPHTPNENEAIVGLASVFENDAAQKRKEKKEHETEIDELYAQIGKLTTQNEWLKKIWSVIFLRLPGNRWSIGLV